MPVGIPMMIVPIYIDTGGNEAAIQRQEARREYVKSVAGGKPASDAYRDLRGRL